MISGARGLLRALHMPPSFARVLSLSARLLAATCGTALAAAGVVMTPGCYTRCSDWGTELRLAREDSGSTADLRAVAVDGEGRAVAVGDGGTVLRRDLDGGWKAQDSGVKADLFGVATASDGSRSIAVGAGGTLLISYAGIGTWVAIDTGITADLRAIVYLDTNVAVAVGDGVALRSEDSGETWIPAEVPAGVRLRAVAARNVVDSEIWGEVDRELLAVGDAGAVLFSGDDGVTWTPEATPLSEDLIAVSGQMAAEDSPWVILGSEHVMRGEPFAWQAAEENDAELLALSSDAVWQVGAGGSVRWFLGAAEHDGELAGEDAAPRLLAVAGGNAGFAVGEGGVVWRLEAESVETGKHWCDQRIVDGRPFIVDEQARTAEASARSDWRDLVTVDAVPAATRARLAAAWTRDGLFEHASIASFARFALQLLAVGAPPDLVLAAQAAFADEVRHAQVCFGLASAYAGAPVGPGPLAIDGALAGPYDLASLAAATAIEGCVNETIAALAATTAAELARDPVVREHLTAIAADERRHAALAWRTVAWAVAQGDARVRVAVAKAFARPPGASDEVAEHGLERHGRLSPHAREAVARVAWQDIIAPQAAALLGMQVVERSVFAQA